MPILEIFANQAVDPIPIGVRSEELVQGSRILATDPETGDLPDGIEAQLRNCYRNLQQCVESAGGTLRNVAHVSMFFANLQRDREAMNPAWLATFPDETDRPTFKFMPAKLPDGHLVHMEFYAVLGETRQALAVPGVAHTNPIPLGVKLGPYVFSSRMLPYDPKTGKAADGAEAQAAFLFENCDALFRASGVDWPDVWQARAFLADPGHRAFFDEQWQARFPNAAGRPPLSYVRYGGGALQIMVEVFAKRA